MPYRPWLYAVNLLSIPLFACLLIGMVIRGKAGTIILTVTVPVLLLLCATGGVLGVLMTMGKLRMRCPFCATLGTAWVNKSEGLRMKCPRCGLIWSGGRLRLQVFREREPEAESRGGGISAD